MAPIEDPRTRRGQADRAVIKRFLLLDDWRRRITGVRGAEKCLCLQQAPQQQCLHVTPPISNHKHVDIISHHPVDDAVRLEEDLTVLPESQCPAIPSGSFRAGDARIGCGTPFLSAPARLGTSLPRRSSATRVRQLGQMLGRLAALPVPGDPPGPGASVPIDVIANLLQVACRVLGQLNPEGHQLSCSPLPKPRDDIGRSSGL